jgi:hypothetical protein
LALSELIEGDRAAAIAEEQAELAALAEPNATTGSRS